MANKVLSYFISNSNLSPDMQKIGTVLSCIRLKGNERSWSPWQWLRSTHTLSNCLFQLLYNNFQAAPKMHSFSPKYQKGYTYRRSKAAKAACDWAVTQYYSSPSAALSANYVITSTHVYSLSIYTMRIWYVSKSKHKSFFKFIRQTPNAYPTCHTRKWMWHKYAFFF